VILLAIDTATPRVSVALWGDDGPIGSSRALEGRRHAEILAPAVQSLVEASGHTMADLTAVAVDIGPGLFTGLRVGVATAKALSAALDLPAVGLTSLEVLAHPHRRQPAVVAAVVDARRHEVFRALYRPEAGRLVELRPPAVVTPSVLAEELAALGGPVLAVGDGARRYAEVLLGAGHPDAGPGLIEIAGPIDAHPDADVLGEMAIGRLAAGLFTDAAGLHACYLRQADVRIGWDQRDVPRNPSPRPDSAVAPGPEVAPGPAVVSGPEVARPRPEVAAAGGMPHG
jgi:tRNA threonylcarbamoyladenosine biosynthesis protein TsaB